jgi:glutamate racemase
LSLGGILDKQVCKLDRDAPIGVFDSGMGGLTVLKALKAQLPQESFVYLGDTARLPYGTKSQRVVMAYAKKMTKILLSYRIKMLVVACNTATAAALSELRQAYPWLPMVGVVVPGACEASRCVSNHKYALLATETTIRSRVYQQTLVGLDAQADIVTQNCGLFVALAEENHRSDAIARVVVSTYLKPILAHVRGGGGVILGCTHFPVLRQAIVGCLGDGVVMIDSAVATADHVVKALAGRGLLRRGQVGVSRFLVTDLPERFLRIGPIFLGESIEHVTLVSSHDESALSVSV